MRAIDIYYIVTILDELKAVSNSSHTDAHEAELLHKRYYHYHGIGLSVPDCILEQTHGVLRNLWKNLATPFIEDLEQNGYTARIYNITSQSMRVRLNNLRGALNDLEQIMKDYNGSGYIFTDGYHKQLPYWVNPHNSNAYEYIN